LEEGSELLRERERNRMQDRGVKLREPKGGYWDFGVRGGTIEW